MIAFSFVVLVIVSGGLATSQLLPSMPLVHACNACNFILTWGSNGSGNGQFSGPKGVAVDSSGKVYVADGGNQRVERFTSTGSYLAQLGCLTGACSSGSGNGQFNSPYGVAVGSGRVYVTDSGNDRVEKFSSSGPYLSQWGSYGSGNGQFNGPVGVAVDSSGNVYVADTGNNRVETFTSSGTFLTTWGSSGAAAGQFNSPHGIAVDSSGNVYVVDTGNNRVEKFTTSSTFITQWGSSGTGKGHFISPLGIAVDSSGNVYVADNRNNRVEKFSSTGTYLSQWGSYGSGKGQFNGPVGVAVDSAGNVYVVDGVNARVEKFGETTSTMTVSYSLVGGGSPSPPVFNYVLGGAAQQYTLTTTPNALSVDTGSSWSVTTPLSGSSAYERWPTSSPSKGTAKPETLVFQYQHQYLLAMEVNPSAGGTVSPAGASWQNSGVSGNIQATPNSDFAFLSWTGNGTGSYTGTNDPASATLNGPITEIANFQQTSGPLNVTLFSPKNDATVTSSPVGLRVTVVGFVQGATVTIFLDGNQVCSGSTDSTGSFSCKYAVTKTGMLHSWYATASKAGFTSGTSPTWTFTY